MVKTPKTDKWEQELSFTKGQKANLVEVAGTYKHIPGRWLGRKEFRKGEFITIIGFDWNADEKRPWQSGDVEDDDRWIYKEDLFFLLRDGKANEIEFLSKISKQRPAVTPVGATTLIVVGWSPFPTKNKGMKAQPDERGMMLQVKNAQGKKYLLKPKERIFELNEEEQCLMVSVADS